MQPLQHLAVASQCLKVKTTFLGLNTAPLQRETESLQPQVTGYVEVTFGVLPTVTSLAAAFPRLDPAGLLPVRPLVTIVTFNLMCSRRHAPQKIVREPEIRLGTLIAEVRFGHALHSTIS